MSNNYAKISLADSEDASTFEDFSVVCHSPVSTSSAFSSLDKNGAQILEEDASIGNQHYDLLNDELLLAITANNLEKVQRLLEKGVTPNATRTSSHLSALHLASLDGLDEILDALLSAGAHPGRTDIKGRSPLHLATWAGHKACVTLLVKRCPGLVTMKVEDQRAKPVDRKWLDIHDMYHTVMKHKLPVLTPGSSALHVASQWLRHDCAKILLNAGADVHAKDNDGMNPLDVTGEAVFLQDPGKNGITSQSFMEVFLTLINNGAVPSPLPEVRQSPLHVAVALECPDTLEKLLASTTYGGRADVRNSLDERPLDLAIKRRWTQGVVLLSSGADVTTKSSCAKTVLHLAAEIGDEDIMRELLKYPLAARMVNRRDEHAATALFYAIRGGHIGCMVLLLSANADVTKRDIFKKTVLHCACENNQPQIIHLLFENDFKSMTRMKDSVAEGTYFKGTPLHFAAHLGYAECVKALVRRKCNLTLFAESSLFPYTALQLAANSGHCDVVKILLDVDKTLLNMKTCTDKLTSLHLACQSGHDDCVEILVKAGSDLSALCKDKEGRTKSAIDLLINRVNSPVELMTKILDSCIAYSKHASGYRCIDVDYNILLPDKTTAQNLPKAKEKLNSSQLYVIDALLKTGHRLGQRDLLTHPLIESFLRLQWNKLSAFYYVMIAMFTVFVLSFTSVALFIFTDILHTSHWYKMFAVFAHVCYVLTILTLPVLLHYEMAQFCVIGVRHLKQTESWVKLVCYILYPCSIAPVTVYYYKGIKKDISDWTYQVGAVSVLLGWLELMLLLSRVPKYGYFVQIFIRVARSFLKVFGSFACFIIGFMLAFYIAFKGKSHFSNIWDSFVKIIVMLTSEYDYGDLFEKYETEEDDDYKIIPFLDTPVKYESYSNSHILFMKMLFVLFVLFVGIVLTNVMVAVAVDDVKDLNNLGKIDRLHRQARFLSTLESIYSFKLCCVFCLPYNFIQPIMPTLQLNVEDCSLNGAPLSERLIRAMMAKAEANKKTASNNNNFVKK